MALLLQLQGVDDDLVDELLHDLKEEERSHMPSSHNRKAQQLGPTDPCLALHADKKARKAAEPQAHNSTPTHPEPPKRTTKHISACMHVHNPVAAAGMNSPALTPAPAE